MVLRLRTGSCPLEVLRSWRDGAKEWCWWSRSRYLKRSTFGDGSDQNVRGHDVQHPSPKPFRPSLSSRLSYIEYYLKIDRDVTTCLRDVSGRAGIVES